jgi:transmembrane sensor
MNNDARKPASRADDAGAPFDWASDSGLGAELARETRVLVRRRRRQLLGAAGVLSMVLIVVALVWRDAVGPAAGPAVVDRSYKVAAPERRVLPDGSRVDLNGDSDIAVEYSPGIRRVVLVRGEALFDVAKDSSRPFIVEASGAEVRAIGTVFSVARDKGVVDVVVTEGQVAVKRLPDAAAPTRSATDIAAHAEVAASETNSTRSQPAAVENDEAAVTVDAGNGATVRADEVRTLPSVRAVSQEDVKRRLAWRVPRLAFDGTPLVEVARLFGEHGNVAITIADPSVRTVKVSGILRADNTDALLQLLANDHGIEAERVGVGFALRRRR